MRLVDAIVIITALTLMLVGVIIVWRATHSSSPTPRVALWTFIAGLLGGIATNALTYYALKTTELNDSVFVDPIKSRVAASKPFDISGRATVEDHRELWVVVYRASGGFEVANRAALPVSADGTWTLSGVKVGRPSPEKGKPSPDRNATYTVSAAIVSKSGAAVIKERVRNTPPDGATYMEDPQPPGLVVQSNTQVTIH